MIGLAVALIALAAGSDSTPLEAQKLFAQGGAFNDGFGWAVDIDGDRIVVGGAPGDRAWVFDLGSELWTEQALLVAPDVVPGDQFGQAVGVSGDTVVVGAHWQDGPGGSQAGAAHVFVRVAGGWTFQQKLTGSLAATWSRVGQDVAIDGDRILLASNGPHAYAWERSGSTWSEVQVLTLTDGGAAPSVALEGDRAIVGSPGATFAGFQSGAAYVWGHDGQVWQLEDVLLPSTTNPTSSLGTVVRLSGDTVLATAWGENVSGVSNGAAYVFRDGPAGWVEEARLVSPQGAADDDFGRFADIEGDRIAISEETGVPLLTADTCYLFERSGGRWSPSAQVTPAPVECDRNGVNCLIPPALGDPWLVVGAAAADGVVDDSGAAIAYLFADAPVAYCTAKVDSQGCTPAIGWSGDPTVTGPDDFVVAATPVPPKKNGLFFFGTSGPAAVPFQGGTLCATPPLQRGSIRQSTPGAGCTAAIADRLTQAEMAAHGLDPGERLWGQFWLRDPAHPDGTGTSLSDALEIQIQP